MTTINRLWLRAGSKWIYVIAHVHSRSIQQVLMGGELASLENGLAGSLREFTTKKLFLRSASPSPAAYLLRHQGV